MSKRRRERKMPVLQKVGDMFTYADAGVDRCLGFLMVFPRRGTYDPTFGRVDVSAEDAERHNVVLSGALVEGLDKTCGVGQSGVFYLTKPKGGGPEQVTTWTGTVVGSKVTWVSRHTGQFVRGDKVFEFQAPRGDGQDVIVTRVG
jgi:hypothetical protein